MCTIVSNDCVNFKIKMHLNCSRANYTSSHFRKKIFIKNKRRRGLSFDFWCIEWIHFYFQNKSIVCYWYRKYHFYILQWSLSYAGATIPSVPVGFHSHFKEHDRPSTSNVCPDNTSPSPKRFGDEEANLGINKDVLINNINPLKCRKILELRHVDDMDTFFIIYFSRQFSSSS